MNNDESKRSVATRSEQKFIVERGNSRFEFAQILSLVLPEIESVLLTGNTILSPEVQRFEDAFGRYVGCEYALGVNSGTDALVLAIQSVGIGHGDEVVTVANTFHATALAIARTNATPVLVDARADDFLVDVDQLERVITPRTKAIIIVHLYGKPIDVKPIIELCKRHGLRLIEDCAQAVGATVGGRRVGSLGDIGCLASILARTLEQQGMLALSRPTVANLRNVCVACGTSVRANEKCTASRATIPSWMLSKRSFYTTSCHSWTNGTNSADGVPLAIVLDWRAFRSRSRSPASITYFHLFQVRSPHRDLLLAHLISRGNRRSSSLSLSDPPSTGLLAIGLRGRRVPR